MREFDIQQASLNVKWNYPKLMSALPVTGTEAFAVFCDKLAPFGLDASRILLEAPTTKLGDAVLTIILLEGRLGIKFWISSFEIIIDELYEDDEQNVVDVANVIFDALGKIGGEVGKGAAHIRLLYHLKLSPNENSKILSEHLRGQIQNARLIPEMAEPAGYSTGFRRSSLRRRLSAQRFLGGVGEADAAGYGERDGRSEADFHGKMRRWF